MNTFGDGYSDFRVDVVFIVTPLAIEKLELHSFYDFVIFVHFSDSVTNEKKAEIPRYFTKSYL